MSWLWFTICSSWSVMSFCQHKASSDINTQNIQQNVNSFANKRFIHLISPDSSSANISVLIIRFFHRDQNQIRYSCSFKTAAARLQNTHCSDRKWARPTQSQNKSPNDSSYWVPAGETAYIYIYLHKDPKNYLVNIQAFSPWIMIYNQIIILNNKKWTLIYTHTQTSKCLQKSCLFKDYISFLQTKNKDLYICGAKITLSLCKLFKQKKKFSNRFPSLGY